MSCNLIINGWKYHEYPSGKKFCLGRASKSEIDAYRRKKKIKIHKKAYDFKKSKKKRKYKVGDFF